MVQAVNKGSLVLLLCALLTFFSGCSSNPLFHSLFDFSHKESANDARFQKDYPQLKAFLRDNHFRQALSWVTTWEKVNGLSDDNRRLLLKDKKTICMIGASYYMGIARERKKAGHLHGALEALDTARSFTPKDPLLRSEIEKTKAQMIVSGKEGDDWGELLQKLLALKAKNPGETTIDPTIGWAYGKLAESEYNAGRYPLALEHARMALVYEKSDDVAARIRDQVSELVRKYVDRAEQAYRDHRYQLARENLERALKTDPHDSRARKDWRILSETPGRLDFSQKNTHK